MPQLTATRTWILIQFDEGETQMDDETRRYCVLMVPFALKLFFGLYPESCRFLNILGTVAATHAAHPADRRSRRRGKCVCVHRLAMMSPMLRGQSARSRES